MSERSEFGQRAGSGEERRGPMRLHRIGECPAKGLFGSFLVLQKGTRTRKRAKALQLISLFSSLLSRDSADPRRTELPRCSRGLLLSWQK
ncbi:MULTISPECIES: hypothetical protein [Luteimonas]|uniref:hypothetical protein n=1 Tax=Luteimonas TaxID=83614 RepID=UPI0013042EF5|nr:MULTISPECIES: hypothetical protein [Luteimonas]